MTFVYLALGRASLYWKRVLLSVAVLHLCPASRALLPYQTLSLLVDCSALKCHRHGTEVCTVINADFSVVWYVVRANDNAKSMIVAGENRHD